MATPDESEMMDEYAMRPLHDMARLRWVRRLTLRTRWNSGSSKRSIDITIDRESNPERFYWRAAEMDPSAGSDDWEAADLGLDTATDYATPIDAFQAGHQAVAVWINR